MNTEVLYKRIIECSECGKPVENAAPAAKTCSEKCAHLRRMKKQKGYTKELTKNVRVYTLANKLANRPKTYIKSGKEDFNPNVYIDYLKKSNYKYKNLYIQRYKIELELD